MSNPPFPVGFKSSYFGGFGRPCRENAPIPKVGRSPFLQTLGFQHPGHLQWAPRQPARDKASSGHSNFESNAWNMQPEKPKGIETWAFVGFSFGGLIQLIIGAFLGGWCALENAWWDFVWVFIAGAFTGVLDFFGRSSQGSYMLLLSWEFWGLT